MWGIETQLVNAYNFVQGNSLFDVENKKAKAFNPLPILKGNSTCMAYWKKLSRATRRGDKVKT
jgi:hypothetical protein